MKVKNPKLEERAKLMKKLREHATELDEIVAKQRETMLERQIETFLPMTAALVAGIFFFVALGVQMVGIFYPKNINVTPPPQKEPVEVETELGSGAVEDAVLAEESVSVRVLQGDKVTLEAVQVAEVEREFIARELPLASVVRDIEKLGTAVDSEKHLVAEAVDLMKEMKDLIVFNTREHVLTLEERVRRFYLNSHVEEMERALNEGRATYLVVEQRRAEIEAMYNQKEARYDALVSEYGAGLESFDGAGVEGNMQKMRALQAELGALNEEYLALGDVMERMEQHYNLLERKKEAVAQNVDALVAGVQVTLVDPIDLGLILK